MGGEVEWFGEDRDDLGKIIVEDNIVFVWYGMVVFTAVTPA